MVKLIRSAQDLGVTNPTAQIEGEAEADEMILVENGNGIGGLELAAHIAPQEETQLCEENFKSSHWR